VAHSILAVTGLVVIAAVVVWVLAGSWRSLLVLTLVALAAGFVTRFLVSRDQRARLLGWMNR
jgi:putative flippase GtrA